MQLYYEEPRHHHNVLGHCVTGQEGNQIMFSCEHGKLFRVLFFLFSMVVNFLHVNDGHYFVVVC
jgi:hypothetical protein